MTVSNCSACSYYIGGNLGVCRRYPYYQNRSMNEWCGEFAEKAILPEVNPLGVFSNMGMTEVAMPPLKRGRPRK
jgi:hypothetical protein